MTDKTIRGVGRLSDGSLRLVGEAHDGRLTVYLPKTLVSTIKDESRELGISAGALVEDAILSYLSDHGYKLVWE